MLLNLPVEQQALLAAIALNVLLIIGLSVMQLGQLGQLVEQSQSVQKEREVFQLATKPLDETQNGLDGAVRYLVNSDPETHLTTLQRRITEGEVRADQQAGANKAADIQDRLQAIRERQQKLRDQLGETVSDRRAFEPVFNELTQRQKHIDGTLSELEIDDGRKNIGLQIEGLEKDVVRTQEKLKNLQSAFASLQTIRADLSECKGRLAPLEASTDGLNAILSNTQTSRDSLIKAITRLEGEGEASLVHRVAGLKNSKDDASQRIGKLDECFATLDAIRKEFVALTERHKYVERSIAEIELGADGQRLETHLESLRETAVQTRSRVWGLQDSLSVLNGLKQEFGKMQLEVAPLQSPDQGVGTLKAQVQNLIGRMNDALLQLESDADKSLVARIEDIKGSKADVERRIEQMHECFKQLETVRGDVGRLFSKLNQDIATHV